MPVVRECLACSWGHSFLILCICTAGCGRRTVRWHVTDGATMASSDDDGLCFLGTHPHTLPCLSVGVMAAGAWSTAAAAAAQFFLPQLANFAFLTLPISSTHTDTLGNKLQTSANLHCEIRRH
ncbi:hypothetical protein TcG_07030 [Trypanosoma cruzi]|nr:hypothetical protein TcG_07030 [Trypanosoma cruzi]